MQSPKTKDQKPKPFQAFLSPTRLSVSLQCRVWMVYRSLVRPILFHLPPETAHHLALKSLSLLKTFNSIVSTKSDSTAQLEVKLFGLTFTNPVGLAAGFDKDGIALSELASLGFGHIEAGTVTYHPQPGNPK